MSNLLLPESFRDKLDPALRPFTGIAPSRAWIFFEDKVWGYSKFYSDGARSGGDTR